MNYKFADRLVKPEKFLDDYLYNKNKFLLSLQQRFSMGKPEYEMLHRPDNWQFSIPHENSGPCYTYNPPEESDPGFISGILLQLNMENWDPDLDIFIHKKEKFFYQDDWTSNTIRIDPAGLNISDSGHPRIIGNVK